jgi:hypothetical protein
MMSVEPSKRPEVKDIISEHFRKVVKPFIWIPIYQPFVSLAPFVNFPPIFNTRKMKGYFKHRYKAFPKETDERVIENRSQQLVLRKSLQKPLLFP